MELTQNDAQWAREVIRKVEFFAGLTKEELDLLAEGFEKKFFSAGSTIIFQGEIANKLFIIQSGKVSIMVRRRKKVDKVAELGPTDIFGEISLLTPRAATATVKTDEDTEILILPGEAVQKIVKNNSLLAEKLHRKIEERLQAQKELDKDQENPQ